MSDPGYVIAGWSLAAIVLGLYTFRLARKIRSAEHARRIERTESETDSGPTPDSDVTPESTG